MFAFSRAHFDGKFLPVRRYRGMVFREKHKKINNVQFSNYPVTVDRGLRFKWTIQKYPHGKGPLGRPRFWREDCVKKDRKPNGDDRDKWPVLD